MKRSSSLIEVMAAVAILVVVLVGLLATFVYCIAWSEHNNNTITAAIDAQSVMEELQISSYNDVTDEFVPLQEYASLSGETVDIGVTENNGGKDVEVTITWAERDRTRTFTLKSFLVP